MNLRLRAKCSITSNFERCRIGIWWWQDSIQGLPETTIFGQGLSSVADWGVRKLSSKMMSKITKKGSKWHCECGYWLSVEGRREWGELVKFKDDLSPCYAVHIKMTTLSRTMSFHFFPFNGWKSMFKTTSLHLKWKFWF